METAKYTAEQVAKELTPSTDISVNGKILIHNDNTELRLSGEETFIAVSGWLTKEGLVSTHIWYFTKDNENGDPTETYYKDLTAEQVAVLYNHLIKTAPAWGYTVSDKEETTTLAAADEAAYDPDEIETYTTLLYGIIEAMEKARIAADEAEALLQA